MTVFNKLSPSIRAVLRWFNESYLRMYALFTFVWCMGLFLILDLVTMSGDEDVRFWNTLCMNVVIGLSGAFWMVILHIPTVQKWDENWRRALAEERFPQWTAFIRFLIMLTYWIAGWVPGKVCDWYSSWKSSENSKPTLSERETTLKHSEMQSSSHSSKQASIRESQTTPPLEPEEQEEEQRTNEQNSAIHLPKDFDLLMEAQSNPDFVLGITEKMLKDDPALKSNIYARSGRYIAFRAKGMKKLQEAIETGSVDFSATIEPEDLREHTDDNDLYLLEQSLREFVEVQNLDDEGKATELLSSEGEVEAMALILERCRPGRAHAILGWTKLRYFGMSRVKVMDHVKNAVPKNIVKEFLKVPFSFPFPFKSAAAYDFKCGDSGKGIISYALFPNNFSDWDPDDEIEDHKIGSVDIWSDGNYEVKTTAAYMEQTAEKSTLTSLQAIQEGDTLGNVYKVIRVLGEKDFRQVYQVQEQETDDVYTLKTLRDDLVEDFTAREAFKKGVALWINLEEHPFILSAQRTHEFSGRLFVRTEYVAPDDQGRVSLLDHIEKSKSLLKNEEILEWAIQFCYGMEHANSHGIQCHRDNRPSNIFVMQDGTLKTDDFGLAATIGEAWIGQSILSKSGMSGQFEYAVLEIEGRKICGTPGYIPPEMYEGRGGDQQSDIYSFGIVLWQMVNGSSVSPFHVKSVSSSEDQEEYLKKYLETVYQKQCSESLPRVDSPLQPVIERCLLLDTSKRYRNFSELRVDLEPLYTDLTGRSVTMPTEKEKDALFWNNKGVNLLQLDQYSQAIVCFGKALEINPDSETFWENKALCLGRMERYEETLLCIERALELAPEEPRLLCTKGYTLKMMEQQEEALQCYDLALKMDPQCDEAWDKKAEIFTLQEQYDEALRCLDHALAIAPSWRSLWQKGAILGGVGRLEEALDIYVQLVETDPLYANTWFYKAMTEERLGQIEEAISSYGKFLDLAEPTQDEGMIADAQNRIRELR